MTKLSYAFLVASVGLLGIGSLSQLGKASEGLIGARSDSGAVLPSESGSGPTTTLDTQIARTPSLTSARHAAGLSPLRKVVRATLKSGVQTTGKNAKRNRQIANALEVIVMEGLEGQDAGALRRLEREAAKRIEAETGHVQALDAEQFVDALERLGPGYQKLGQILSTRSDVMRPTFSRGLERLTSDVKPPRDLRPQLTPQQLEQYPGFDFDYAVDPRANEAIYGRNNGTADPSRIFNRKGRSMREARIILNRLGSGTVADVIRGQYRRASSDYVLPRPESDVVLKQIREGVPEALTRDLEQIERAMAKINADAARLFAPMMEDLRRAIAVETDLRVEARALQRAKTLFTDPNARVPEVFAYGDAERLFMSHSRGKSVNWFAKHRERLTPRPLTISRVQADGQTVPVALKRKASPEINQLMTELDQEAAGVAENIVGDVLDMLLGGFLHGDLHGGNILYDAKSNTRTYLDWGLHAEVSPALLAGIVDLQSQIKTGKALEVAKSLYRFETSPSRSKRLELRHAIAEIIGSDATEVQKLAAVIAAGRAHGLNLPPDLGLIGKSLYQVEGTLNQISPGFDFAASIKRQMPMKLFLRVVQN